MSDSFVNAEWESLREKAIKIAQNNLFRGAISDSEDIAQETLIGLLRTPGTTSHMAMTSVIARRRTIDANRRCSRDRRCKQLKNFELKAAKATYSNQELIADLTTAIFELPRELRTVIELRTFEGRSFLDIASLLGTSNQCVRRLFSKAVEQLRLELLDKEIVT